MNLCKKYWIKRLKSTKKKASVKQKVVKVGETQEKQHFTTLYNIFV